MARFDIPRLSRYVTLLISIFSFSALLLFLFAQPLFSQAITLTYDTEKTKSGICTSGDGSALTNVYTYFDIVVTMGGTTVPGPEALTYYQYPSSECGASYGTSGSVSITGTNPPDTDYVVTLTAKAGGIGVSTADTEDFFPSYKVVSILYSPPGNQSSQGYIETTTNGTTTTVGSTFTSGVTTAAEGMGTVEGITISGGGSWGESLSSIYTDSENTTWTDATGYASASNSSSYYNPTATNVMNHNLDTILIWLNPEAVVTGTNDVPSSFSLTEAPIPNHTDSLADVLSVVALDMEETQAGAPVTQYNPTGAVGVTTVKLADLDPQGITGDDGVTTFMPGLAAVCASQTLYQEQLAYDIAHPTLSNPASGTGAYCTQTNQCGCTPADFANILEQDMLLDYTATTTDGVTTYASHSTAQTTDPTTLDESGQTTCEKNPIPAGSNCRYVVIPSEAGGIDPYSPPLNEASPDSYAQTDSKSSTLTDGTTSSYSISINFGLSIPLYSLKVTDTWTWTDTESTGTTTGSANTMNLSLKTSTVSCDEYPAIYEDTIYHTFVFAVPEGNYGCT